MNALKSIMDVVQQRQLRPGDRLPSERDLAERLGIGRNAVREGLAALTTLRVLESRPNSGIYLRQVSTESSFETLAMLAELGAMPTRSEIAETTEVRLALEVLTVEAACARRSEDDIDRMHDILTRTDAQLRGGGNIAELDTEFHLALVSASQNTVLVRVLNTFYRITAQRRRAWFQNQAQGRSSARDHRRLLEAVIARDAVTARAAIERHMQRASAYWEELLR